MSSRAPGTRREKGFLIDRAEALRSTELAIRQVGWDGAHASLLQNWSAVAQAVVRAAALCRIERGGMDAVWLCTRLVLAGQSLDQREGCILDSPAVIRAQRCWAEGVKSVVQIPGPLRQQWLGMGGRAGGQAGEME